MIDLEADQLAVVQRILAEHVPDCEVRVFGSRVNATARKYSDLDLALVSPKQIGSSRIESLKDAFAASDLPIQVDVLDWHTISPSFQKVIENGFEIG